MSSGNYASFPVSLSGGSATISVPAGVLAAGTDVLTANFTSTNSQAYGNATATASVAVTAAGSPPSVSAASTNYATRGKPFRAVPDNVGDVLVSVTDTASYMNSGVQVFSQGASGLQPKCLQPLPSALQASGNYASGISLFNGGADLIQAVDNQLFYVYPVAGLHSCNEQGVAITQGPFVTGEGSFDATVTADGKYAFVANEYGMLGGSTAQGNVGVLQLQYDANGNFTGGNLLGAISTGGQAVTAVTLSPDGSRLYVTSEIDHSNNQVGAANPILTHGGCVQDPSMPTTVNGLLTVIDTAKFEASPTGGAVIVTVNAGCSPVRVVETSNQGVLWVAARGDNRVLAFNPGMLEANPANALLGYASTGGIAPVGLTLFHNQQLLAVANSNRFATPAAGNITILSVAVPSSAAVVQTVATGYFPREVTVGADDNTLYLANYDSQTLQVITPVVQ